MTLILAADLKAATNANLLILDSIWNRGRKTNGGDSVDALGRTISDNVRMFDLPAAGR